MGSRSTQHGNFGSAQVGKTAIIMPTHAFHAAGETPFYNNTWNIKEISGISSSHKVEKSFCFFFNCKLCSPIALQKISIALYKILL